MVFLVYVSLKDSRDIIVDRGSKTVTPSPGPPTSDRRTIIVSPGSRDNQGTRKGGVGYKRRTMIPTVHRPLSCFSGFYPQRQTTGHWSVRRPYRRRSQRPGYPPPSRSRFGLRNPTFLRVSTCHFSEENDPSKSSVISKESSVPK